MADGEKRQKEPVTAERKYQTLFDRFQLDLQHTVSVEHTQENYVRKKENTGELNIR